MGQIRTVRRLIITVNVVLALALLLPSSSLFHKGAAILGSLSRTAADGRWSSLAGWLSEHWEEFVGQRKARKEEGYSST